MDHLVRPDGRGSHLPTPVIWTRHENDLRSLYHVIERQQWCQKAVPRERRRHARYRMNLPATFFTERTSELVTLGNISAGGCRVESKVPVTIGDVGQLLIDLPGCNAPLKVSQALVRWVRGQACGVEFIRMDPDEERWWPNRLTSQLGVSAISDVKQHPPSSQS